MLREQKLDIFRTQVANEAILCADNGVGKVPLRLLKLNYLFFDRVPTDKAVGKDLARLTNSVGPVDSLSFDGWVPPRVQDKYVIGGGKVQTQATCLETDQEEPTLRMCWNRSTHFWRSRVLPSRYSYSIPLVFSFVRRIVSRLVNCENTSALWPSSRISRS